jgi:UTP--glucose-1-phosphate uridylyltransferase
MHMPNKITKAVFPVAGFGTRFLPESKVVPKEMLPIVDKPLIQYAVEEVAKAGIKQLIFITSSNKRSIEDHFDANIELESILLKRQRFDLLEVVQNILPKDVSCIYVRQHEQLGLGHAVLCAKEVVGNEDFAVLLPDDLIDGGSKSCIQQMLEIYNETGKSVLAVEEVPQTETNKYGIVAIEKNGKNKFTKIASIVEKPKIEAAPSNLAVVGRYILSPQIFAHLEAIGSGAMGEIQLTDGIGNLLKDDDVYICKFHGRRYDCGSKTGYLEATVEYALKNPEVNAQFAAYMRKRFNCQGI